MDETHFLKIDGFPGNSTDPDHAGWFDLTSFTFPSPQSHGTGASGAGPGKAHFTELSFTTRSGPQSPRLFQASHDGSHIRFAVLEGVRGAGGCSREVVYRVRFTDVGIKSHQVFGSSIPGDPPVASCVIEFLGMQLEHGPPPPIQRAHFQLIQSPLGRGTE